MKDNKTRMSTAVSIALAIVGIVFIVDLFLTVSLKEMGLRYTPGSVALMGALLLAAIIALPVFWLVKKSQQPASLAEGAAPPAPDLGQLAMTDTLTRLPNKRGITMNLLDAMAQAQRYGHPLTVALVDVDLFKRVNDTYGQKAGDSVLSIIAAILQDALRMPDKVGRYGGEEFLVVLPHTGLVQGRKIAERMRAAVERSDFDFDNTPLKLTISIGVTQFRKGEDLEQLLSRLDKAVKQAKTDGRNTVVAQKAPSARAAAEKS